MAIHEERSSAGEHAPQVAPQQARQGVKLGSVRYVLAISLALGVAALAVVYFLYA